MSGTLTVNHGGFYSGTLREVTWRGRVEFGPRFYAEPTVSLNYFATPFGDGDANIVSSRFTNTLTPRIFASALDNRSLVVKLTKLFRFQAIPLT